MVNNNGRNPIGETPHWRSACSPDSQSPILPKRSQLNAWATGCNGYCHYCHHSPGSPCHTHLGNGIAPIARAIAVTLMIIIVRVHLGKFEQSLINTPTHSHTHTTTINGHLLKDCLDTCIYI